MNIKKLFDFRSKEEKINQYRKLLQKSQNVNKEIDNLADEFAQQNSIVKSISTLDTEEKEDALKRYDSFLKEHAKHIASVQKEKASIEKSIKSLEDDTEIAEALVDMKDLFEAKGLCKSGVISKSIYNDIIKAKIGKVKYADVLLFRGDKLLILQRVGDMGESTTEWCIPGGHVDAGEEWREAAHRELLEETGFDVPEDLLYPVGIATGKDFEIHYYDCLDNHSRLEPNKKDAMDLESLARVIPWYLKERIGGKVIIHENEFDEGIISFKCHGYEICGVHGDHDKPSAVVDNMCLMTHRHYDMVLTAHLHHFSADEKNETVVVSNGSLMGTDTYAKNLRLSSKASQNLIIVGDNSVCECIYRIILN